jgi:hypothetical protein
MDINDPSVVKKSSPLTAEQQKQFLLSREGRDDQVARARDRRL